MTFPTILYRLKKKKIYIYNNNIQLQDQEKTNYKNFHFKIMKETYYLL